MKKTICPTPNPVCEQFAGSNSEGGAGFFNPHMKSYKKTPGYMPYKEQIRSPEWIKFATDFKAKKGWKCQSCQAPQSTASELTIHHVYYMRGMMVWDYPDFLLECLCWNCHKERQDLQQHIFRSVGAYLSRIPTAELDDEIFWPNLALRIAEALKERQEDGPQVAPADREDEFSDEEIFICAAQEFSRKFPLQAGYMDLGQFQNKIMGHVIVRFAPDDRMAMQSLERPGIRAALEEILSLYFNERVLIIFKLAGEVEV